MRRRVAAEPFDVEAELLGVADQSVRTKRVLVPEQQVVHLPERALIGRRLGGLGGELGVRVDVVERQVPPDVSDIAEVGQQLPDDRLRLPAVGALEVAVLDDRHRRVDRPADVVALRIDRSIRSTIGSAAPSSARARRAGGSRAVEAEHAARS